MAHPRKSLINAVVVSSCHISADSQTSLEPIAAAENFNVFVPMMMRKNVELQLQALQMIEVRAIRRKYPVVEIYSMVFSSCVG